jgi:O-antigen ligase
MKKTVTTLLVVSLAGNIFPAFNIAAISGLFPMFLVSRDSVEPGRHGYDPSVARKYLLAAYLYWIASYICTGAPIINLFSFDFLRFDGALLIAYLPLLLVADTRLDPLFIRRTLGLFLNIMSIVALLGLAEFVDSTVAPFGLSQLPESLQLIHNAALSADIFHGFFRAHNAAGAIYSIAALISFALLARRKNPALLSWPAFWFATNVTGIVLTQSRTAYVAFLATLVIMFFRQKAFLKRSLKYAGPILLPLSYLLLVQPSFTHRAQEVSDLEDPNIVTRFVYYQRAIDDFAMSPVVGTGFGRFNDQLKIYSGVPHLVYFATGGASVDDDSHAHNSYLHFLAEGGIVGLALMLGVWIATFRWVGRQKHIFEEGSFGHCFALGLRASIVLEFFMSFTEHMMGTAVSALTIFTFVGLFLNLVGWKYRVAAVIDSNEVRSGELAMESGT